MFAIQNESKVPIYEQIVAQVTFAIAAGDLEPGDPILSVRKMAEKLLVNPNTVARAFEELERRGVVTAKRGRAMEVTAEAPEVCRAQRHGNHVLLQAFAETHAGIEAEGNDVDDAIVGHQLHPHARVFGKKPCDQRGEHEFAGRARCVDSQRADRGVTESVHFIERTADVPQRWRKTLEQPLPGLGGCHAASRAVQQAHAEPRLQPPQCMTQRGGRNAQLRRCTAKAAGASNGGKGLQIVQRGSKRPH